MNGRTLNKEIIKDIKKSVYLHGFDCVSLILIAEKHNFTDKQYLEALEYMKAIALKPVGKEE